MPRKLESVPRNALESLIHELDQKLDRATLLRRQAEDQCERMRKKYFDARAHAETEQWKREDLVRDVRVILKRPGHADDNVEQALKRLEGL